MAYHFSCKIPKDRIVGYDVLKTLAMYLVMVYHMGSIDFGTFPDDGSYFPNLSKVISSFGSASVPLFLLVNGALTGHRKSSTRVTVVSTLFLLFLAFVVPFFFRYLIRLIWADELPECASHPTWYYFLFILAFVHLVHYFFRNIKWASDFLFLFLLIYPFCTNLYIDIHYFFSSQELSLLSHTGFFLLYSFGYYYLGSKLKSYIIPCWASIFFIIFGIFLVNFEVYALSNHFREVYDSVNSAFPTLGAMSLSCGLFFLLKDVKQVHHYLSRLCFIVGHNTLWIYITHFFFSIWFCNYFFHFTFVHPLWVYISAFFLLVFLSLSIEFIRLFMIQLWVRYKRIILCS